MLPATLVNDLTIEAATVNGSGSQSANLVITKAIFHMGIPVAPKNVFPSNIEGLPTWFDVRVSPQGYGCRSGDVHILISLNATTWLSDVLKVRPGGAVIHDAGYPMTGPALRDDVTFYPVPFARLAKEKITRDSLRKYLTNMIYVGVLAELVGIDMSAIEQALKDQFQNKTGAIATNIEAVQIGIDYARENFSTLPQFRLHRADLNRGRVLMDGNQAAALGSLMAGCTVAAWYPITPSSSLCESFIRYCERFRTDPNSGERRYAVVQAEDELAAIGMVLGATWAGARAMTSTSGPGLSLMAEFAGYGYFTELPAVIFDIQRVGPSTGMPTRTMQGDVATAYTLSHGDTRHIVLMPGTVTEAYTMAMDAFDLADRFQTPVFVLSDLDLGMNPWLTDPLPYPERGFDRGKVLTADQVRARPDWGRYRDVDGDGISYRTLPGNDEPRATFFTRGSGHDENALYSESPEVYRRTMDRLARKHETARHVVPPPLIDETPGRPAAVLAYGTTHHAVVEARDLLRGRGVEVNYIRVLALPFTPHVADFIERHERVYVVEQNRDGQLLGLLRNELTGGQIDRLRSVRHADGVPIGAEVIVVPILDAEAPGPVSRAGDLSA